MASELSNDSSQELIAIRHVVVLLMFILAACADPAPPGAPPASPTSTGTSARPSASAADGEPAASTIADCDALQDAGGLDLPPTTPPEPGVIPTPAVQAAHDQQEGLINWAQTEHGDTYGGIWIDGEALVIAFTDAVDARRPQVESRFTDAPVHVVEVTYSEAELYEIHEQVAGLLDTQERAEAGWINSVGIRTNLNRVSVGVVGDDTVVREDVVSVAPADAVCLDVQPIPGPADAVPSPWSIPPGHEPDPQATSLEVWVHERACASGQPATDRVEVQDITVTTTTVSITLGVIPVTGDAGCPSNPPTPFTVELPQPLGDRQLIDGSTGEPPTDPDAEPGTPPAAPPGPQPTGTITPPPSPAPS